MQDLFGSLWEFQIEAESDFVIRICQRTLRKYEGLCLSNILDPGRKWRALKVFSGSEILRKTLEDLKIEARTPKFEMKLQRLAMYQTTIFNHCWMCSGHLPPSFSNCCSPRLPLSQVPQPTCYWKWVGFPIPLKQANLTLRASSSAILRYSVLNGCFLSSYGSQRALTPMWISTLHPVLL